MPLLGAIAGCHCRVLWWGEERVTTNFAGVGVVAWLAPIAGCHCGVLWGRSARPTLGEWMWCHCWVPLLGAILVCYGWEKGVVPLQGAIVVCHCSVLWFGGRLTTNFNFGKMDGAIVGCHCRVLWWEGRALGGSGRGAIAGCHCWVPISVSYLRPIFRATNFTHTPKKTTMNFVWSFLQMLYTALCVNNTKIVFCYLGYMLV